MGISQAMPLPVKIRGSMAKLKINIEALCSSHIVREHLNVTLCDINQLKALYNDVASGNACIASKMRESEVFITNGMRPVLESSGFALSIYCGQYFINWPAMR